MTLTSTEGKSFQYVMLRTLFFCNNLLPNDLCDKIGDSPIYDFGVFEKITLYVYPL